MPLISRINNDFTRGLAVYGAGFLGTWAAQYLQSIGANVTHFIDRDSQKNGTMIHGIPIVLPTDPIVKHITTVLIAARHAVKDVQDVMASNGRNLMSFDGYYIVKNYKKLCFIRDNFFNDEKSIETYNAIMVAMLTSSVESCLAVMEKDMYFALPEFSGTFDDIFVDAGAFVGDTVERFIWENLGTFRYVYAFEPGRKQFLALKKRMLRLSGEWAIEKNKVTIVRAGLAEKNGHMTTSFSDDLPIRHGLVTSKNKAKLNSAKNVRVYSLDSFLNDKPITFLKADIEGMEMDLLRGAQKTILKNKPKMALCVYHYPSDLIEIPKFVRKLVPEYKFSIRQHAPILGDFVLYCYCV
jgi:FkbM family methyltransferase